MGRDEVMPNYKRSAVMGIMSDVAAELRERDRMVQKLWPFRRGDEAAESILERVLME